MLQAPVLFMLFNRPKQTERVLQRIIAASPRALFVSADGPRKGNLTDEERCAAVRSLVDSIPKNIKVYKLYREKNLGCKKSGISALSWFFEENESGIVLEDDTLPDPSFFSFAEASLQRYRNEERVMLISGHNPLGKIGGKGDTLFSKYPFIWGWASWRRAWKTYSAYVDNWDSDFSRKNTKAWLRSKHAVFFWRKAFHEAAKGSEVWDYQLCYSMFMRHSFALVSSKNLVGNIGFGGDAVHTINPSDSRQNVPVYSAGSCLNFPKSINPDPAFEKAIVRKLYRTDESTVYGRFKTIARPPLHALRSLLKNHHSAGNI